jgi:small-conductance mechanosensitive channel
VADLFDQLAGLVPSLFLALLILFAGAAMGQTLGRLAAELSARTGPLSPPIASTATRVLVFVAAANVALDTAGLAMGLPVVLFAIALTALLALIVVGLLIGARGVLENLIAARYVEEQFVEGQTVSFRGEAAQVRAIGLLATVLRTASGLDVTVPNSSFVRESV